MKLYTEEQVRQAMLLMNGIKHLHFSESEILNSLTPIELPSDEEIEKKSYKLFHQNDNIGKGTWIYGAIWMKEQILNQNK